MMLATRSQTPEMMDDPAIGDEELEQALDELRTINHWLGGHAASCRGVARLLRGVRADEPVTILDLGAGGMDLRAVLTPLGRPVEVTALDINERIRTYAARHGHGVSVHVSSAHALPFADHSFDIVHASLFLHHCTDEEARNLLMRACRIARHGVVINDLHRHPIALLGIGLLTALFSRSATVRHDALVSVRRAFRREELLKLLPSETAATSSISWRWAFRWLMCISLNGAPTSA